MLLPEVTLENLRALFEAAHEGTILLDEIGSLPLALGSGVPVVAARGPETDDIFLDHVNVEFAGTSKLAAEAEKLAWLFRAANDRYATDYPAAVGDRMSNTDSQPFQDLVAAISLRENERLAQIGSGWDPHWHQPTDVYSTYSDADFRLGLNAAQTTLAALAQLAGASVRR